MSIESLISRKPVIDFLNANNWKPVRAVTFGSMGEVLIIEKNSERMALKIARNEKCIDSVRFEYSVLKYLADTPLKPHVPEVKEWLEGVKGFLMEYLYEKDMKARRSETWILRSAEALRIMHNMEPPAVKGIPDDGPDISRSVRKKYTDFFNRILQGDEYWKELPKEYRPKLEIVRGKYETYSPLIPEAVKLLKKPRPALTHGDLDGGHFMSRPDGTPVFADWGEARISSGLVELSYYLTFVDWDEQEIGLFLEEYFESQEAVKEALPCIRLFMELNRYFTCVGSLWWIMQPEDERLDTVGIAFFEKVLKTL